MIATGTRIALSLTPSQLRGAVVRGTRVVRAESVNLTPEQWASAWEEGLVPLDRPLRQLLARLSAARGRPRVSLLYHGPHTTVQTHEVAGVRDDARRAAAMKIRESAGTQCEFGAGVVAPSASKPGHWAVLAVADREEETNRLFAWVTRCGGRLDRLAPQVGTVIQAAAERVLDHDTTAVCCYVGSGWSAIACGSKDGLYLLRAFEFGHRLLSDVFQRALSAEPGGTAESDAGERMLFEHGLPLHSTGISPELRARILPMAAPVLQRFCVEVKQTLRFGVPADQNVSNIILDGPGASIGHLASAVTEMINMDVRPAPGAESGEPRLPFGVNTAERAWLLMDRPDISIVPRAAAEQRATRMLRRAMATGVVASGLLLAAELAAVRAADGSLEASFQAHAPTLAAISREEATRLRAREIAMASGGLALRIENDAGPRAPWVGLLSLVAGVATDSVGFDDIEARSTPAGAELRLRGAAVGATDADASAALAAVVQRFQSSPQVATAELGATQREQTPDGRSARLFSIVLRLNPAPDARRQLAVLAARAEQEAEE
jgi:hypothetical protein